MKTLDRLFKDALRDAEEEYSRLGRSIEELENGLEYKIIQSKEINDQIQNDIDERKEEKYEVGLYLFELTELKRIKKNENKRTYNGRSGINV